MECQVVVVGDAKVGKSAIIRRLTQDQFTEVIKNWPPYNDCLFSSINSVISRVVDKWGQRGLSEHIYKNRDYLHSV